MNFIKYFFFHLFDHLIIIINSLIIIVFVINIIILIPMVFVISIISLITVFAIIIIIANLLALELINHSHFFLLLYFFIYFNLLSFQILLSSSLTITFLAFSD